MSPRILLCLTLGATALSFALLAFVLLRAFAAETFTAHEKVSAICVSYYWHFVDIVWVGLFFVVYLLDPVMTALDSSHLVPVSMNWTIF